MLATVVVLPLHSDGNCWLLLLAVGSDPSRGFKRISLALPSGPKASFLAARGSVDIDQISLLESGDHT